jgi:pimeloyl-ACP methyl ester carboxylesterase
VRRLLSGLLALVLLVVVAAFGWRAVQLHGHEQALAIRTANGIDEEGFVRINGVDQWVTIRGDDRSRPVALILHGGPGSPDSYLARFFRPLEGRYVVVHWDQRGAGKTLARAHGKTDPALDLQTMALDGIALSDYLREHLRRDKIILVGHSWGSILGIRMAQLRPNLFAAFVGTGMVVAPGDDRWAWVYQHAQDRAQRDHDAATLAKLREIGPPPWPDNSPKMMTAMLALGPLPMMSYQQNAVEVLTHPHWSLADVLALQKGVTAGVHGRAWADVSAIDYAHYAPALAMPVVIIQGDQDFVTPTPFARAWFDRLQAPAKHFVVIQGQGHEVLSFDNTAFTAALDGALGG